MAGAECANSTEITRKDKARLRFCLNSSTWSPVCGLENALQQSEGGLRDLFLNEAMLCVGVLLVLQFHLTVFVPVHLRHVVRRYGSKSSALRLLGRNLVILVFYYAHLGRRWNEGLLDNPFYHSMFFIVIDTAIFWFGCRLAAEWVGMRMPRKRSDDRCIRTRYTDWSHSTGHVTAVFFVQVCLFLLFVMYLNEDPNTHDPCNVTIVQWLVGVVVTNIAGSDETGVGFQGLSPAFLSSLLAKMAWSFYRGCLQAHPLKTKAATSSFITVLSDLSLQAWEKSQKEQTAQRLQEVHGVPVDQINFQRGCPNNVCCESPTTLSEQLEINWARTRTLAAVGLLYSGPLGHTWFGIVERLVRIRHAALAVFVKVTLDMGVYSPFAIAGYMVVRGTLEGKPLVPTIQTQLEMKWLDALIASWQFWPFIQTISYAAVPVMYRVLFSSACSVFWNARLSYISTQRLDEVAERRAASPGDFERRPVPTVDVEVAVNARLACLHDPFAWLRGEDPAAAGQHCDCLPLPTLGRALAYRWLAAFSPRVAAELMEEYSASAAERDARAVVCQCDHCRAMHRL